MGAALNPGVWTVTESAPGNVQINANFACVQGIGNNSYTDNGMLSTASYARAALHSYEADLWVGTGGGGVTAQVFGLSNGVSVNYTNYYHGVIIGNTGFLIFESGSDVTVGPNALDQHTMFRVRITPGVLNGALYESQGGTIWPKIGDAAWHTLLDTRGVSAVSAASFQIGYTPYYAPAPGGGQYMSHVKVY
jgi:hypothetical protein